MKYFITYLLKGDYRLGTKLVCKSGTQTEVSEDIFNYLNSTFGDSGWFTFKKEKEFTEAKPKKTRKKKEESIEEVIDIDKSQDLSE